MTEPCWCVTHLHKPHHVAQLRYHYMFHGCERARRIMHLIVERGMTLHAASIVVDAAMFGIGCKRQPHSAADGIEEAMILSAKEKSPTPCVWDLVLRAVIIERRVSQLGGFSFVPFCLF